MALITSAASGNFNAGATWTGGIVPGVGDEARASNGHTITITDNTTCSLISNLGTGNFVILNGVTLTANITSGSSTSNTYVLRFSEASPAVAYVVGNVVYAAINSASGIINTGTGTLTLTGNVSPGGLGSNAFGANNTSTGALIITGNCTGATWTSSLAVNNNNLGSVTITGNVIGGNNTSSPGVTNASTGWVTITGNVTGGAASSGIVNNSTGTITVIGDLTASTSAHAVSSTNASAVVRLSGSFICASNGLVPVNSPKFILNTTPLAAKTRYALSGAGTYVDMFTADNNLGQANPTDVRSGVSYANGNLTGRLTVPARGSVALSVAYGPSMPFTATRSGTTATATLTYSYPLVVGDQITVTDASNSEWNSTYTITSIVSGTSVTFEVPASHSSTAGTGANMQTTGTAVLDGASVASAVWSAAARTITGGTVDTLTNAPTVPSASAIASQVRTELTTELGRLDASVSSRLAGLSYTAPTTPPTAAEITTAVWAAADKTGYSLSSAERTAIASAVEGSLLNEADGQAVLNAIVGAIGNTNLSEVSLVAAVRADLERAGGKLDSIPTTAAPSASAVASATRTELSTELSRIDQSISSRLAASSYTAPANSDIAAIKAKTDNLPASPAATGDIPSANITAIKAKTDQLNTDRLANVATTNIVGTLLAQANS